MIAKKLRQQVRNYSHLEVFIQSKSHVFVCLLLLLNMRIHLFTVWKKVSNNACEKLIGERYEMALEALIQRIFNEREANV